MNCTNRVLNSVADATGKTASGLFHWMTTDHIGKGRSFENMPTSGLADTITYIFMELFFGILCAVLSGAIAYVMIAYGIPLFFTIMLGA